MQTFVVRRPNFHEEVFVNAALFPERSISVVTFRKDVKPLMMQNMVVLVSTYFDVRNVVLKMLNEALKSPLTHLSLSQSVITISTLYKFSLLWDIVSCTYKETLTNKITYCIYFRVKMVV
jgi:hypothetical protein